MLQLCSWHIEHGITCPLSIPRSLGLPLLAIHSTLLSARNAVATIYISIFYPMSVPSVLSSTLFTFLDKCFLCVVFLSGQISFFLGLSILLVTLYLVPVFVFRWFQRCLHGEVLTLLLTLVRLLSTSVFSVYRLHLLSPSDHLFKESFLVELSDFWIFVLSQMVSAFWSSCCSIQLMKSSMVILSGWFSL